MKITIADTEKRLTKEYPLPAPYVWKIKGQQSVDDGFYPTGENYLLGIARPVNFIVTWYPYATMTLVVPVNPRKGLPEFEAAATKVYNHPSSWVKPELPETPTSN